MGTIDDRTALGGFVRGVEIEVVPSIASVRNVWVKKIRKKRIL
jgi:hypothetical protein